MIYSEKVNRTFTITSPLVGKSPLVRKVTLFYIKLGCLAAFITHSLTVKEKNPCTFVYAIYSNRANWDGSTLRNDDSISQFISSLRY